MGYYAAESGFLEQFYDKVKKFTNTQWLIASGTLSAILLFMMISQTSGQKSRFMVSTLHPEETRLLQSGQPGMLEKRWLHLEGNVNATNVFILDQCPKHEIVGNDYLQQNIDVPHHGKEEKQLFLQSGSIVNFSVKNATGEISVHVFSNWMKEHTYERHEHRPHNDNEALYSGKVDVGVDLFDEFIARKSDTYVFLFQGMSGDKAFSDYHIQKKNYVIDNNLSIDKNKLSHCSYKECKIPINTNKKKCIAVQSIIPTKNARFRMELMIKHELSLRLLIAFVPFAATFMYLMFFKAKSIENSVQHMPGYYSGYELVVES